MSTELVVTSPTLPVALPAERSIEEMVAQADKIKRAMTETMQEGVHYGVIPGATKPSLWKAGAEKLNLMFRLDPQYHSEAVAPDLGVGGHLSLVSVCTLYHIPTGARFGSGEASCSTRESKYAYRIQKRICPHCAKETVIKGKAEYGGGWICWKKEGKSDGCGAKYKDGDGAIEGQETGRVATVDLADSYNTVRKMANKRALVAAILNVTAASDVFTQDLEDFERSGEEPTPPPPSARPASRRREAPIAREALVDEAGQALITDGGEAPDDAPLNEALERSLLLAKCKAAADTRKLSAAARATILDQYQIRDPREASLDQLQAMLEHLRGLAPGTP